MSDIFHEERQWQRSTSFSKIMIAQNASDMHLSAGSPPYLRIHGSMAKLDHPALDNKGVQSLIF